MSKTNKYKKTLDEKIKSQRLDDGSKKTKQKVNNYLKNIDTSDLTSLKHSNFDDEELLYLD